MSKIALLGAIFATSVFSQNGGSSAPCPAGFAPPDCQVPCTLGYYGNNCTSPCPETCTNNSCQPDNGSCFQCQPGFTGLNCSVNCQPGLFGQDCKRTCPGNCFKKLCDPFTGVCDKCVPGYEGTKCETHYSIRKQGKQSASPVADGSLASRHLVIYVTAATVSCIMSLCTIGLCVYLVKIKMGHDRISNILPGNAPIYRIPSSDTTKKTRHERAPTSWKQPSSYIFPSHLLHWSGVQAMAYHKMGTNEKDCGGKEEDRVEKSTSLDSPINKADVNARSRDASFIADYKHAPSTSSNDGRASIALSTTPSVTEGMILSNDSIDAPELSKILTTNAPLSLDRAANYSRDLFFKTHLPYQRFRSGSDDRRELQVGKTAHGPPDGAGVVITDQSKGRKVEQASFSIIDERDRTITGTAARKGRSSEAPTDNMAVTSRRQIMAKDKLCTCTFLNLASLRSQDETQVGVEPQPSVRPDLNSRIREEKGRTPSVYKPGRNGAPRAGETGQPEKAVNPPATPDENNVKVYAETTQPLAARHGPPSRLKQTWTTMMSLIRRSRTREDPSYTSTEQADGACASDLGGILQSHATHKAPEMTSNQSYCAGIDRKEKDAVKLNMDLADLEMVARELPKGNKTASRRTQVDHTTQFTNPASNNEYPRDWNQINSPFCANYDSNKSRYIINRVEHLHTFDFFEPSTRSIKDADSIYFGNQSECDSGFGTFNQRKYDACSKDLWSTSPQVKFQDLNSVDQTSTPDSLSFVNDTANNPGFCRLNRYHSMFHPNQDPPKTNILCKDSDSSSYSLDNSHSGASSDALFNTRNSKPLRQPINNYTTPNMGIRCSTTGRQQRMRRRTCESTVVKQPAMLSRKELHPSSLSNGQNSLKPTLFTQSVSRRRNRQLVLDQKPNSARTRIVKSRIIGIHFLNALQVRIKRTLNTMKGEATVRPSHLLSHLDLEEKSTKLNTDETIELSSSKSEVEMSDSISREKPLSPDSTLFDDNLQCRNTGCSCDNQVSLIPKSIISMTVRKHFSKELKAIYTNDVKLGAPTQMMTRNDVKLGALTQTMTRNDVKLGALTQPMTRNDVKLGSLTQPMTRNDVKLGSLTQPMTWNDVKLGALTQPMTRNDVKLGALTQPMTWQEEAQQQRPHCEQTEASSADNLNGGDYSKAVVPPSFFTTTKNTIYSKDHENASSKIGKCEGSHDLRISSATSTSLYQPRKDPGSIMYTTDDCHSGQAKKAFKRIESVHSEMSLKGDEKAAEKLPGQASKDEKAAERLPGQASKDEKAAEKLPGQASKDEKAAERLPGQASKDEKAAERLPGQASKEEKAAERLPGQANKDEKAAERLPDQANKEEKAAERLPGQTRRERPASKKSFKRGKIFHKTVAGTGSDQIFRKWKHNVLPPLIEELSSSGLPTSTSKNKVDTKNMQSTPVQNLETPILNPFLEPKYPQIAEGDAGNPQEKLADRESQNQKRLSYSENKKRVEHSFIIEYSEDSQPVDSLDVLTETLEWRQDSERADTGCRFIIGSDSRTVATCDRETCGTHTLDVRTSEILGIETHTSTSDNTWSMNPSTLFYTLHDEASERFYDAIEGSCLSTGLITREGQKEHKQYVNMTASDRNEYLDSQSKPVGGSKGEDRSSGCKKDKRSVCMEFGTSFGRNRQTVACLMNRKSKTAFRLATYMGNKVSESKLPNSFAKQDNTYQICSQESKIGAPEQKISKTDKLLPSNEKINAREGSAKSLPGSRHSEDSASKDESLNIQDGHTAEMKKPAWKDLRRTICENVRTDRSFESEQYSSCVDFTESQSFQL